MAAIRRAPAALAVLLASAATRAEDRADTTVTWVQERRAEGSVRVIHPQADISLDLGSVVSLSAGYEADIVSGATPSLYAARHPGEVDVVSSASDFSDTRHSGRGSIGFTGSRSALQIGYRYGTERDYRSQAIGASGSVDLVGKNTNFALAYSHEFDDVCDRDNGDAEPLARRPLSGQNPCFTDNRNAGTVTRAVHIDSVQATLTQVLTPTLVLQVGIFGQVTQGFQGNPYRRVRVFSVDAQESVPDLRDRAALFARLKLAFPDLRAVATLALRGYSDTWGICSGDVEVTYQQYFGRHLLLRLRGRGYQQSGATFFKTATEYELTGPAGRFFTGDREHAPLRDLLVGVKLSYIVTAEAGETVLGLFDEWDVHANVSGLWAQALVDGAPGAPAGGPLPDAIIAELGILLHY